MGLPGSGKSTLASALYDSLFPDAHWLNADAIREQYNDWDFSYDGRIRQSERMRYLADVTLSKFIIADFIAPLPEMRSIFNADLTIWVDTIKQSIFKDTNKLFVPPLVYDFRVTDKDSTKWSKIILQHILNENNS